MDNEDEILMLDHTTAEKLIRENAADFYQHLITQHSNGFPVSANTIDYWKKQLEKEFPNENKLYPLSNLDIFTYYIGFKFLQWRRDLDDNQENSLVDIIIAANLKNYEALQVLLSDPKLLNNNVESLLQNAKKMKETCNSPAGDLYLCSIVLNQPDDIKQQHAREVLNSLNNIQTFFHDWDNTEIYSSLKQYDKTLAVSFTHLRSQIGSLIDTYTQLLKLDTPENTKSEEPLSTSPRVFNSKSN